MKQKLFSLFFLSLIIFTSCSEKNYIIPPKCLSGSAVGGCAYAELYNYTENGFTLVISDSNLFYNVTNLYADETNNVNLITNGINISQGGIYKADVSISFSGSANSLHELTLLINGEQHEPCTSYRKLGSGGDVGNAGSTCLFTAQENDIITLGISDKDIGANNVNIWNANLNIFRLGGSS